ncbi:uncharacterized protein LOC118179482 [Stegodyphus dumicola]|uniref:uncharacterized protein LOC118179482 n=1 Tax=Stegodyphus dumicola TaxID=202533 RepID=UPI0015AB482A|nr:uncharacterized protein LOC118179482 [Stegodyphus dumicola]
MESNILHKYEKGAPPRLQPRPHSLECSGGFSLKIQFEEGVEIQAYADDFIIVIAGGNRLRLEDKAHKALDKIHKWSQNYKLKFSIEKTKLMLFPKGNKLHRSPPRIKWNNIPIPRCETLKYLGFTLDQKLTWIPHLGEIREKTLSLINSLNRMVTHRWNLKGKLLKTLYLQAVERMVLYGCPIWYTGTERQKQKLSQIQRIALLCITKAFSTAPTSALQILAGILPLDLKAKMEAGIYRLHHYKENLQIGDVIIWAQEIEERIPTIGEHPALTQKVRWYKDPPEDKEIEAFTDGSKKDNRVGAAFVIYKNSQEIMSKQIRLNDEATVFQAEVVALKEVCKWLSHNADSNTPIKIFTDSQSSLQSLNKIRITSSSIKAFKEIICTLQETHNTVLNWVKAHEGTKGNERADEEAKRATERDTIDIGGSIVGTSCKT